MQHQSRILVAGYRGLVGSAIVRRLRAEGFENLILRSHGECDLENQGAVFKLFLQEKPEFVFMAAAKVGGILANSSYPVDFIRSNLMVQNNIIDASHFSGVQKLLFLGSSCIYPKLAPQPIKEEYLLTGDLEPTNEWYAIAKIAGIKMCQAYRAQYGLNAISLMPTNLYGPGDNFDLNASHVLPALLRKFHEAKCSGAHEVVMWGSGTPRREFLHVDDLADACIHLMQVYDSPEIVNVGTGEDITIHELAEQVKEVVGFKGQIIQDTTKPDGTPRKLLDVSRLHQLGWRHRITLVEGIRSTYQWFLENQATVRA
ncbi:GDP-L-fucose synthase [Geothrix oryzae]|uniref:GDP-L-fucose synthase n=1 Tax=Geothrix oryzae TaxID=2927975 RepID=A0ABN6V225_9BACT|nr:GDP-L-fucose synthase [Geothrix oryzae]BDU70433.1 GDP-L-fucose synthase [Geothrix oryzae]